MTLPSTILIVDDDPGLRRTLSDILRFKGYAPLAAGTGAEGLSLLRVHAIDLLLIDLGLPDMSGLDLLNRVKMQSPDADTIILTGNATLDSAVEATNRGAFSYLIKPFEIEQLMLQVQRAVEKQHDRTALRAALEAQEQRSAELAEANRALEAQIVAGKVREKALHLRQRAIESSSNGIMIIDLALPDHPLSYVNPAFERITGFAPKEVMGRNLGIIWGDDREQPGRKEVRSALREQREGHTVLSGRRKDGTRFWTTLSLSPVRDDHGGASSFIGILNDITETKRYEQKLEYQAYHDGLTGLPNRNLVIDRLDQALSYAHRYRQHASVLFVGLDHFKIINDSLGYEIGDRLLKIMSERLTGCVRTTDTVARHGGDEFVLILVEATESEEVSKVAIKILNSISRPCLIDEHELIVTCSIGISLYPKDGKDAPALLNNAHVAMYRAKDQGRNSLQFYTRELNARTFARMTMEKHLRRALERQELLLHYQPQVDLETGRITGMEGLLRWQSPELGLIPPARFIPLAEETGLIVPIGEWVMKTCCAQTMAWRQAGLPPLVMAVNLSPRQFRQQGLTEMVARILAESGLDPSYLELEVIESMVMHDVESALAMLNEFKDLGVKLAMDDFGTGYSSLGYLKKFPFSKIKIDQSFVRDITSDPDNAAIARAIIALGHSLNLRIIAEGIETEGQLRYLRSQGCDEMQGFYFSRPVPPLEFEQMLREGRRLELPAEEPSRPDRTLLLVDDEPHVLAALKRVLADEGYHILTATSAVEGLELLAVNPVGVVVSDMYMPGMNGTEFLSRVKEIYTGSIRIMLSGSADMDALTEAINRGSIFKFLIKPWQDERLRLNLKEAFQRYRLTNARSG
jgi:diguanylate cyclase (GGDEF)-like protein/PAS domain S-box-containing protein